MLLFFLEVITYFWNLFSAIQLIFFHINFHAHMKKVFIICLKNLDGSPFLFFNWSEIMMFTVENWCWIMSQQSTWVDE